MAEQVLPEDIRAPKPVLLDDDVGQGGEQHQIVSSDLHPKQNLLAVGDIAGNLIMYLPESMVLMTITYILLSICRYSYEVGKECHKVCCIAPQAGHSCRVVRFSMTGKCEFVSILAY